MDPLFDDFSAYDTQYNRKFENLFDQDFSLSSPFSENSDSTGIFPAQFPKTIKNLLDADDNATNQLLRANNNLYTNKAKPFQIIKQKKDSSPEHSEFTEPAESIDSFNLKEESDTKIHNKSKRITKQEKPKEKIKFKQDPESIMKRVDARYIPDGFDNPELDDQTKKKMVQMIRNRVSAQSSRDKKKMYVNQLEDARDELIEENTVLVRDKEILQNRISSLEHERAMLIEENDSLKNGANFLCSKCGCSLECDVTPETMTMESTDSNTSSPVGLHRAHRRSKNFFGFTLGFAALMCVLFVMNGGLPTYGGNNVGIKTGTGKYSGRYIATHIMKKEQNVCENQGIEDNSMPIEEMTITEEEEVFEPSAEETSGVLDVINSLMDQFSKLHETYFQSYETNNKDIINLPEVQSFENRAIATASDCDKTASEDFQKYFANKASFIGTQNKSSSTLFCPNGFEFFKTKLNMETENEKEINFFNSADELAGVSKGKALDLEKAEYIQLILPKQSISRLSLSEYYKDLANIPVSQELEKEEEENTLIEVWCKIFAIRDVVTTF